MDYKALGQTGELVSTVGFGGAPLGGLFGAVDTAEATRTVHAAIDSGVNIFDTAPYYGKGASEERLGRTLTHVRDEVLIATKVGRYGDDDFSLSEQRLVESVQTSLRLLATDYVDLLFVHDVEFFDHERALSALEVMAELKAAGTCRFIGVSGYPLEVIRRMISEAPIDVVLTWAHGTLLDRRLSDELSVPVDERGVGLINGSALMHGLLTDRAWAERLPSTPPMRAAILRAAEICKEAGSSISFLANQFAIQCTPAATTLVGTRRASHLEEAVTAAGTPIDRDVLAKVLHELADVANPDWEFGRSDNN